MRSVGDFTPTLSWRQNLRPLKKLETTDFTDYMDCFESEKQTSSREKKLEIPVQARSQAGQTVPNEHGTGRLYAVKGIQYPFYR